MRGSNWLNWMERGFALHRGWAEADNARAARERAFELQERMLDPKPAGVFGMGRLATSHDVEMSGQFGSRGLFMGALNGRLLFYPGEAPVLSIIPTGGGKGRDFILPTLALPHGDRSLFIVDVKDGENAYAAARFRHEVLGERCIFINPFGIRSHEFPNTKINPFQGVIDTAAQGRSITTQATEIAQILLPRPADGKDGGWVRSGAVRIVATYIMYLARYVPERCTPESIWHFINASDHDLDMTFALMASCGDPAIEGRAYGLNAIRMKADKQWAAYASSIADAVEMFEPGSELAQATSANEFDPASMKQTPTSVFMIVPSGLLHATASFLSLNCNHFIETIAAATGPLRTTFILDELAQLNPMQALTKALLLYRGRGIQTWSFLQSRSALEDKWGIARAREFENQAAVMIMRGVDDPQLMRDVELWSGNCSVVARGASHNGGVVETASASLGESKRPVLQSEDIKALGAARHIIKVAMMPHLIVADGVPHYRVDPWNKYLRDVRRLITGEADNE